MENKNNKETCGICEFELVGDNDFCPNCGALLIEEVECTNHPKVEAIGVCVICSQAFCNDCGGLTEDKFLCNEHENYETFQNMARVYGSSDEVTIRYAAECLEQAGLHPFVFSRKASPMHLGGADYSLFRASGDTSKHIVNEIKLLVPHGEVLEAEKILEELDIE
ncbi:MAG: hypothetical protein K8H86_03775 [Ignavibacteriaceae bacterium]|nr:hypothetical protein [Ignavibacteriaceae bacterium]